MGKIVSCDRHLASAEVYQMKKEKYMGYEIINPVVDRVLSPFVPCPIGLTVATTDKKMLVSSYELLNICQASIIYFTLLCKKHISKVFTFQHFSLQDFIYLVRKSVASEPSYRHCSPPPTAGTLPSGQQKLTTFWIGIPLYDS